MSLFGIWRNVSLLALAGTLSCAAKGMKDFTIIVLPDTQHYSESYPQHFAAQTQWIKDNVDALNIKYVLHLGDVTEHNSPEEWKVARAAMDTLNGVVPYAICPGNHDYSYDYRTDIPVEKKQSTLFTNSGKDVPACFGTGTPYATQPSLGGFHIEDDGTISTGNSWHTFEAQGEKFLVVALEWGPRDSVVEWANRVVRRHPKHHAILITHAYMYHDGSRLDWTAKGPSQSDNPHAYSFSSLPGGANDGEELWQKLVKKNSSFFMVASGHICGDGTGLLASIGDHGNKVHQMLSNYQMLTEGGQGYLRICTFKADRKHIEVKTYSPILDKYKEEPDQQFTLSFPPALEKFNVVKCLLKEGGESIPVPKGELGDLEDLDQGRRHWLVKGHVLVGNRYGTGHPGYPVGGHQGNQWFALNGGHIYQALPETYVPGMAYRLSFWATATKANLAMYLFFTDGDGNRGLHNGAGGAANKHRLMSAFVEIPAEPAFGIWHQYSIEYIADINDKDKRIGITIYGRSGVFIDDVSLIEIPVSELWK